MQNTKFIQKRWRIWTDLSHMQFANCRRFGVLQAVCQKIIPCFSIDGWEETLPSPGHFCLPAKAHNLTLFFTLHLFKHPGDPVKLGFCQLMLSLCIPRLSSSFSSAVILCGALPVPPMKGQSKANEMGSSVQLWSLTRLEVGIGNADRPTDLRFHWVEWNVCLIEITQNWSLEMHLFDHSLTCDRTGGHGAKALVTLSNVAPSNQSAACPSQSLVLCEPSPRVLEFGRVRE